MKTTLKLGLVLASLALAGAACAAGYDKPEMLIKPDVSAHYASNNILTPILPAQNVGINTLNYTALGKSEVLINLRHAAKNPVFQTDFAGNQFTIKTHAADHVSVTMAPNSGVSFKISNQFAVRKLIPCGAGINKMPSGGMVDDCINVNQFFGHNQADVSPISL